MNQRKGSPPPLPWDILLPFHALGEAASSITLAQQHVYLGIHFTLTPALESGWQCSHFTDDKSEAQRGGPGLSW